MMGFKEKFSSFFFLNDEENSVEGDQPSNSANKKKNPSMNNTNKVNKNDVPSGDNFLNKSSKTSSTKNQNGGLNVVSMKGQRSDKKTRITVLEPRLYSEVKDVADIVLDNQSVILNFRRMEKNQAKQTIDFLMGVTYAVQGDLQRIGDQIFLCTPANIEIDGSELTAIQNNDY